MTAIAKPIRAGYLVWFYAPGIDTTTHLPPYEAVCVLEPHEFQANTAWVRGLHGVFNRRSGADLMILAHSLGLETLLAHRAHGHRIPGGTLDAQGNYRVEIKDHLQRAKSVVSRVNAVFGLIETKE